MNVLTDSIAPLPLSLTAVDLMAFAAITLHLLFVLLTVGTAILAVTVALSVRFRKIDTGLVHRMLTANHVHRSLAVALGFGPLLLLGIASALPLSVGINFFAPWLLGALGLMTASFILLDRVRASHTPTSNGSILFIIIAAAAIAAIPAAFALVMTGAEGVGSWVAILDGGFRLDAPLGAHWITRSLHLLGASIAFAAGYHLMYSAETESQRGLLLKWFVGGLLAQIVLGMLVYAFLPAIPALSTKLMLLAGISGSVWLLWMAHIGRGKAERFGGMKIVAGLLVLLVGMMMARQNIQNRAFVPVRAELAENARIYRAELAPSERDTEARYRQDMRTVYFDGKTIFERACVFCHGIMGDGGGIEARNMRIPPEKISAIRSNREHVIETLKNGVPGTAMPYFSYFDRTKLDNVVDELDRRFDILSEPGELPVAVPFANYQEANTVYGDVCASCHGEDGSGAEIARTYQPPVPDFTKGSLTPERMFEVITNGYPGTAMPGYANMPEMIRWGLVRVIYAKRNGTD